MRIGELATQSGVSVRALRYYEEHGLLRPLRSTTGQRLYEAGAVERVRLLRRLYGAGLSSSTIATLLPCVDSPSEDVTLEALDVMRREHARISLQVDQLAATRDDLTYLIEVAEQYRGCQRDAPAAV